MYDEFGNLMEPSASDFSDFSFDSGGTTDTFGIGGGDLGDLSQLLGFPTVRPATSIAGGLVGNAGRLVAGGIGSLMVAGRRMSMRKVWDLTKKVGPELAAGALGYTAADLISALFASGVITRKRRARGISGRDVRCAKRVVRFVNHMQRAIGCVSTPRHHFARRSKRACA